jgi:hypothetical protein
VSPSYATIGYQWQQFFNSQWANIAGATSSSLTLTGLRWVDFFDGFTATRNYRVVVSSGTQTVTSSAATLTVPQESWQTIATISRGVDENKFGTSVACSNSRDVVAIGIPNNSPGVGRVRIYALSGGAWSQRGSDIVGETNDAAGFGHSVSISADGSVVAVGSPEWLDRSAFSNAGPSEMQGRVLVYQWSGTAWTQRGSAINFPDAPDGGYLVAEFGRSVSISNDGSKLVVGAPVAQRTAGKVYAFDWNGTAWVLRGAPFVGTQETPQGGTRTGGYAGYSVSMSGDGQTIAYGEPLNDDTFGVRNGVARVYRWVNSAWSLETSQTGTAVNATLGAVVALNSDGSVIAVGQPSTVLGNISGWEDAAGEIRVYARAGNGTWQLRQPNPIAMLRGVFGSQLGGFQIAISDDGTVVVAGETEGLRAWAWRASANNFVELPSSFAGRSSAALDSSGRKAVIGQGWAATSQTASVKILDLYGHIPS